MSAAPSGKNGETRRRPPRRRTATRSDSAAVWLHRDARGHHVVGVDHGRGRAVNACRFSKARPGDQVGRENAEACSSEAVWCAADMRRAGDWRAESRRARAAARAARPGSWRSRRRSARPRCAASTRDALVIADIERAGSRAPGAALAGARGRGAQRGLERHAAGAAPPELLDEPAPTASAAAAAHGVWATKSDPVPSRSRGPQQIARTPDGRQSDPSPRTADDSANRCAVSRGAGQRTYRGSPESGSCGARRVRAALPPRRPAAVHRGMEREPRTSSRAPCRCSRSCSSARCSARSTATGPCGRNLAAALGGLAILLVGLRAAEPGCAAAASSSCRTASGGSSSASSWSCPRCCRSCSAARW